jgi:hypothetical protein
VARFERGDLFSAGSVSARRTRGEVVLCEGVHGEGADVVAAAGVDLEGQPASRWLAR